MRFLGNVAKVKGFSLIEVMVALLILSVALLSYSQGQLLALRTSEQAYFINLANLENNALAEHMQGCKNQGCVHTKLTSLDENIAKVFPEGEAFLTKQTKDFQHKICWQSRYGKTKAKLALQLLFRP